MTRKARIALAGPSATIQNTPPLVTSNKARVKHGLSLLTNPDGSPARFDVLRRHQARVHGSLRTQRWRETDSNPRSPVRERTVFETPPACVRRPWPHKSAISDAIAANILFAPFL